MSEKLPTIDALLKDTDMLYPEKLDTLNAMLNRQPPKAWIKVHNGVSYLPIARVEWLLVMLYKRYRVEIKDVKLLANSSTVTLRLHVKSILDDEWEWQDGAGAAPLKTAAGAGPLEFDKMNTFAVQTAVPAAESFAIKDAAEKFGKIFGSDLNRKDIYSYDDLTIHIFTANDEKELRNCDNLEELEVYDETHPQFTNSPKYQKLYEQLSDGFKTAS